MGTDHVMFSRHSEDQMDARSFMHSEVLTCLRKGTAHGPENVNGDWRANVVHRGLHIRVALGGVGNNADAWKALENLVVATVMEAK
jgi:hypothetical protein